MLKESIKDIISQSDISVEFYGLILYREKDTFIVQCDISPSFNKKWFNIDKAVEDFFWKIEKIRGQNKKLEV
jgi:hypothetical protein